MGKMEELEARIRDVEDAVLKLKTEYKNQIYELDENNFTQSFLKKIGFIPEVKKEDDKT